MKKFFSAIKTKRLLLIPFTEKYITPRYLNWLNDHDLMRYSEQRHKKHTVESCRQYLYSFENTANMFWAIEENINGMGHISNINAYIDTHNNIADIGILIGEIDMQASGYGYEAFKGVAEYLFENLGIRKITAGTVSSNLPMIKIMQKMKMQEDGIRKRHYLIEGVEEDILHMALFQ